MKSDRFGIPTVCVLIVGALALMVFRWPVASEIVYPVERAVRFLRGVGVDAENARLRREIAGLSLLRGDLDRLRIENAQLRKALGYRAGLSADWIPAEVLSSAAGASVTHRSLRVDRGSLDGVKEGAVVVVPEGLVGQVSCVSPHTAEIALLTDSSVKVSCEIVGSGTKGTHGILSGGGADRLLIRHLESPNRVRPQARVLTSGLGGVFPRGLEVGTLLLVTNGVQGVVGEVLPRVDCSMLEGVFIRRDQ